MSGNFIQYPVFIDSAYYVMAFKDRLSKATDSAEGLLVPYRFNVSPAANGKCNVFHPNPLTNAQTRLCM